MKERKRRKIERLGSIFSSESQILSFSHAGPFSFYWTDDNFTTWPAFSSAEKKQRINQVAEGNLPISMMLHYGSREKLLAVSDCLDGGK